MKYRLKSIPEVDAIRFDGTEKSAVAVIDWAEQSSLEHLTVYRYLHDGSWNDRHPELWLRVTRVPGRDEYATPGDWIIVEPAGDDFDVLKDADFQRLYVFIEPTP